MSTPKDGDLRVWWIPLGPGTENLAAALGVQVPSKNAFRVPVETIEEGAFLLEVLAQYDLFQFEMYARPDYGNVGGLEVFEDGEWCDWSNPSGEDIGEWADLITAETYDVATERTTEDAGRRILSEKLKAVTDLREQFFFVPWDYVERQLAGDDSWRREVSDQLDAKSIQAQKNLETTERATLAALKAKYGVGDG